MEHKILVSVTTYMGDWQQQISDLQKYNIKEFALFLTGADEKIRQPLFARLKALKDISIPFVHLRSDTSPDEIDYLIENYNTQLYNIHTERHIPLTYDLSKYRPKILIENSTLPLDPSELQQYGGICLDISHLENTRLTGDDEFNTVLSLVNQFKVKANHISGIAKSLRQIPNDKPTYDRHDLESLDQLDYMKYYKEEKYLGDFLALELTNNIETQLKAKEYIENILRSQ